MVRGGNGKKKTRYEPNKQTKEEKGSEDNE